MNRPFILFLIVIITLAINIFSFKQGHDWGGDFAHYIAQSQSIIEDKISDFGITYTFIYNESINKPGPIFAPWGFPILLVPILLVYGLTIFPIKLFCYLFFLCSIVLIYLNFKEKINPSFLLIFTSLIAFHPAFFNFKENIQADFTNLFLSYISLLLIRKWAQDESYFINKYFSYLVLGIIIYLTFFTKTIGAALLFTLFVFQIIKLIKNNQFNVRYLFSNISIAIPYFVFIILFLLDSAFIPSSHATYNLATERSVLNSILLNTRVYLENIYYFFNILPSTNIVYTGINVIVFLFCIFLIGVSLLKHIKNDLIYVIYVAFIFIILLPFPYNGGGFRYLIPVFPILLYLIFKGLEIVIDKLKSRGKNNLLYKIVILSSLLTISIMVIKSTWLSIQNYQEKPITAGPYLNTSQELFHFISNNTRKSDIIIFFKPRVMNLYTGRLSYRINNTISQIEANEIDLLKTKKWDYLAVNNNNEIITDPVYNFIKIVFQNDDFRVYKNMNAD